jgi:anti-sigma B factor antagonist
VIYPFGINAHGVAETMKVEKRNGVTILSTDFRLDAVNAPKLKNLVIELARVGGLKLVIDMEKTSLINSSGCGALLASQKAVLAGHGDMKIVRPTSAVSKFLELTRLNKVLDIHDSLESAIDSFAS